MIHAMKVDLTCPLCPDEMGVLTATVSPEEIEALEDAGCGHAEVLLYGPNTDEVREVHRLIWAAAGEKEEALWDAEVDRRIDRRLGK